MSVCYGQHDNLTFLLAYGEAALSHNPSPPTKHGNTIMTQLAGFCPAANPFNTVTVCLRVQSAEAVLQRTLRLSLDNAEEVACTLCECCAGMRWCC